MVSYTCYNFFGDMSPWHCAVRILIYSILILLEEGCLLVYFIYFVPLLLMELIIDPNFTPWLYLTIVSSPPCPLTLDSSPGESWGCWLQQKFCLSQRSSVCLY